VRKKPKPPGARKFDVRKEVRAIARERVGKVKPGQVIAPKSERRPKHKKSPPEENGEA
jgi:hypothetical protein